MSNKDYVVEVRNLCKYYPIKAGLFGRVVGHVRAVDNVSFKIERGTTMGLVGESGCGKTTIGKTILNLTNKTKGEVVFNGKTRLDALKSKERRAFRPKVQIIFQDPYSSLSPRLPVGEIIGEAVREHGLVPEKELDAYVSRIMKACGLHDYQKDRYPHEFSGGQRQRICIARAIALNPDFIVCDEPVSALDVSIQAQIINLLEDLQKELKLSYVFVAHDLSVVKHISHRVAVMYLGTIVELTSSDDLYNKPLHPYTQALMRAVPLPDPEANSDAAILKGEVPSIIKRPAGCPFSNRCEFATEACRTQIPELREVEPGHMVACALYQAGGANNG